MNEDRQTLATRLQEISDLVVVVRDGEQKTWGAIERISKDLQELIQKDVVPTEKMMKILYQRLPIWMQQNCLLLEHPQ